MAFPTSPVNGQVYRNKVYDTTTNPWDKVDPGKYFNVGLRYGYSFSIRLKAGDYITLKHGNTLGANTSDQIDITRIGG